MTKPLSHLHLKSLLICFVGLYILAFDITLRTEPSTIAQHMLLQFHITPDLLSALMSKYQIILIAMLIVAAWLVDRIGARVILFICSVIAIYTHYLFSHATTLVELLNSRLLLAFIHPFILIGALKLGLQWLPKRYFALYAGLVFFTLLMTTQLITPVLANAFHHSGWAITERNINLTGCYGALLLLCTFRWREIEDPEAPKQSAIRIFMQPQIWLLCLISTLGWITNTFLLNWGGSYLQEVHHFLPETAYSTVTSTFAAFAVGAIIIGLIDGWMSKYLIILCYLIAAMTFTAAVFVPHLSIPTIGILFIATGFFSGSAIICYTKVTDYCSPLNAGLAFGLVAAFTTAGNTAFAWCLAELVQINGMAHPSNMILAIIPISLLLGSILAKNNNASTKLSC